jgi:CBS domain-containing protein
MREGPPDCATLAEAVAGKTTLYAYEDELVGRLADRMAAAGVGRVPIVRRLDGAVVGLVARRDLLRARAHWLAHEDDREALMRVFPVRAPGLRSEGGS